MKGVLLSGGTGSRLRPITHTGPKQLVPVANKPVLEYAVEDLRDAGITEIGIVLGNKGRVEIQDLLGDGSSYGVEITYIIQGNPLGIAHATGCAQDFVGDDDFVVYLGDNILKDGVVELVESFKNGKYGAGIALQKVENPEQFGIADIDSQGNVTALIEKPDEPPTNLALIGMYVFSPEVFDVIERLKPSWRGELEITDAIQALLEGGYAIDSHTVTGWWKDTGKPKDILEANRLVLEERELVTSGIVEAGAETQGCIELAESSTIKEGAVVRGPVSVAENTTIKNGTYVGPYTSIGPNTTLQEIHIENSVVIGDSQITTSGRIVDSLLGQNVTVEGAAKLLPEGQRLVVGENSQLWL
ncbi:glucose-1-phosphate thymidylyltransferase [Halosimplex litoreum]|uniref:Glucose-1-phosphate thymidylyltransferase n=1 Tax=Halosimplex litoreum TaxID=1198301 RepID=A0A7T3KVV2_9EURY|nr:glucose-1-phosphate thymidylyltransferase [Halosimplex litoreum]QPV63210.1 glucose-1-phosphate thymidylyltransferase [Halosimplex litoreum]